MKSLHELGGICAGLMTCGKYSGFWVSPVDTGGPLVVEDWGVTSPAGGHLLSHLLGYNVMKSLCELGGICVGLMKYSGFWVSAADTEGPLVVEDDCGPPSPAGETCPWTCWASTMEGCSMCGANPPVKPPVGRRFPAIWCNKGNAMEVELRLIAWLPLADTLLDGILLVEILPTDTLLADMLLAEAFADSTPTVWLKAWEISSLVESLSDLVTGCGSGCLSPCLAWVAEVPVASRGTGGSVACVSAWWSPGKMWAAGGWGLLKSGSTRLTGVWPLLAQWRRSGPAWIENKICNICKIWAAGGWGQWPVCLLV